ncbi:MAG TPA: ribonuclease G [Burkholderiales bacterium]|nr:ribonuclease G [Burkholderiales bacterium]
MEEILINVSPQETRVAVVAAGMVQELLVERAASRGLVGSVYAGRVARVLPGMQSAFVDIGLERAAFLHIADIRGSREAQKPIEKLLAEGESLLVQVVKDPIGSKGARLSTQLSIAGRLLVYLPAASPQDDPHIGISQKIGDENGRQALRERLQQLLPADEKGGFIVRTHAESATEEELRADLDYLRSLWQAIRERSMGGNAGAAQQRRLHEDLSLAQRVLRDMVGGETDRVMVDSRETFQKLSAFAEHYMPRVRDRLEHYTGERPLFELYDVEAEIERALSRRVSLKSGGTLVIDQTEALTTIDVNTAGFVGGRSLDDTIFKTNLEAAQAIARQLRLRNLGGIIVIDFIDMASSEHRAAVLEELRRALARDRTRMTVNGFTALGLVELTRKRTRESLAHVLCEPCPACDGRGAVKTAHTVCYEILREILREARAFPAKQFRVLASQPVIDLFQEEESGSLAMLSEFIGKPISTQVESSYAQEQFDIVLL